MSAITGIYHFNGEPASPEHGENMMKELHKFPADDVKTYYKNNIFLGCHAQWITPESVGEPLPFFDSEKQIGITADAIIDNRTELFDQLDIDHAKRKVLPDSQLILLAYEKWGEDCPKHLVGDFAFMIWDEREQKLFGARDFSGNRTLYYYDDGNRFVFSTIIKPLFTVPKIPKELNKEWIAEFLAIHLNFESIDISSTVYKNIKQIPPSHSIRVKDGKTILSRYCLLKEGKKLKLKSNDEYEEAFREVFKRAVDDRLRTHHKVGTHLSGGLDSGSVASFAARTLQNQQKELYSFSYIPVDGFEDWTHKGRIANERPNIESIVDFVGNIKPSYLDFKEKNSLTEIDDWLEVLEMPYKYFENSFWLKGIYEEASKQGIGVLLNGQRGNWTISWGNSLDYQARLLRELKLRTFLYELHHFSERRGVKKSRFLPFILKRAYPNFNKPNIIDDPYPMIINPDLAKRFNIFDKLQQDRIDITGQTLPTAYEMKRLQFEKLYYWAIIGNNATKLSLRHGLWERDPTNDLRVIEFCLSVPEQQFIQKGQDRSLIRRATVKYLPDRVRLNDSQRGVQGADGIYRMISSWSLFISDIERLCNDHFISEFINIEVIRKRLEVFKGTPDPSQVFGKDFRVLMRSLIVYRFLKNFA